MDGAFGDGTASGPVWGRTGVVPLQLDCAVERLKSVMSQCSRVAEVAVVVERIAPAVCDVLSSVVGAPRAAPLGLASIQCKGLQAWCCQETSLHMLALSLPDTSISIARRLLMFGLFRLLPVAHFARRGAELVMERVAANRGSSTQLDNGEFGARFRSLASSVVAAAAGKWRVPFTSVWAVMCPDAYLDDQVVNFVIAKLRSDVASLVPLADEILHIPSTHFFTRVRDAVGDGSAASLRNLGLPVSNGRVRLPRLTLVVLHSPVAKHWSLAVIVADRAAVDRRVEDLERRADTIDVDGDQTSPASLRARPTTRRSSKQPSPDSGTPGYPYFIAYCDSLRGISSRAMPEEVKHLRRWLCAHAAGMQDSRDVEVPWAVAKRLPEQDNNSDCGVFVSATMGVYARAAVAECVSGRDPLRFEQWSGMTWPPGMPETGSDLRRQLVELIKASQPPLEPHLRIRRSKRNRR